MTNAITKAIANNNVQASKARTEEMENTIRECTGVKLVQKLDTRVIRDRIKMVNEQIADFNAENGTELELVNKSLSQVITPNGKMPMTLTLRADGLACRIGSVTLMYPINGSAWKEVSVFGVKDVSALDECQLEFLASVSKATQKLIKGYGLSNMNVFKRAMVNTDPKALAQEIIADLKADECDRAMSELQKARDARKAQVVKAC